VVFVNAGSRGANTWMTCRSFTATDPAANYNPKGNAEVISAEGRTLRASGWSLDPDDLTSPVEMHVYVNGQFSGSVIADGRRDDIAAAFPGAGSAHGWSWQMTVYAPGTDQVCVYAINRNQGTQNPLINCSSVVVSETNFQPLGHLDKVAVNGPSVEVAGWTLDPDSSDRALGVHVYADWRYVGALTADRSRPDIAAAFPPAGDRHGFSGAINLAPGVHTVCAFALNAGAGSINPLLGCALVEITQRGWEPVGNLETAMAQSGGRVDVAGWAVDPDSGRSSSPVHLYVDGRFAGAVTAAGDRPDVAAVFPAAGAGHGFTATLTTGAGVHTVCAYGINVGIGQINQLLGCRSVTV
jgi:hypothetical protein